MDYRDILKLKVFFQALKDINFKPNLYNIPLSVRTDCLGLLRKLPQFRGDEFKNDNILINTLIGYLKDPTKSKRFLADAGFSQDQQREFNELLEKEILKTQPELTGEQPSEQQAEPVPSAQQAGGEAPSAMIGGQLPKIPSIPSIPKVSMPLEKAGKNLAADARIGIKKGITRAGTNLSGMLGGVGRGFGGILSGIGSGGVRFLGGAGGTLANMGTQMTRSRGFAIPKKFWLIFLGMFLLVGSLAAFAPVPAPGTQPTPGQPAGQGALLDYTIPFRDSTVTVADPDAIKNLVRQSWPNAQLQNWDTIVDQAIANGWNPAFVLTLWIEETGAQGVPSYLDPLGCAPGQPTTDINLSLRCLFNNFPISKYPNDKFADFMCMYSESKLSPCTFVRNSKFPGGVKDWYSKLVTSGPGVLVPIQPLPPPVTTIASCPVPNGRITTHSYEYASTHPGTRGHCDTSYLRTCKCGSNGRRAKAIDVPNNNQDVILPTIDGRPVNWKFKFAYLVDAVDGGGNGFVFEASTATDGTPLGTVWTLDMLHMASTGLNTNLSYPSNTAVGKTSGGHVHFTLGKNITNNTSPGLETAEADCHPGWIPSDFMCK